MKTPIVALSLCLVACGMPPAELAADAEPPATDAQAAAEALALADRSAARDDATTLARALARLYALGVRAAEGQDDVVQAWQASAGASTPPFRGRALGPAYRRGNLPADGEVRLSQTFLSGQRASIAVSSPGRPVPGLSVTSASGRSVCESAAHCRWTPVFTERYEIVLSNPGKRASDYYLVVE